MSANDNKRIARRLTAELSKGNLGIFDELASPDVVQHSLPEGMSPTRESMKKLMEAQFQAFPDLKYKLEDEIAEGDLVVHRVTGSGTMKAAWMGMQPTGKKATWSEIHIMRFRDGKVVEHWANIDQATMMMQLGLVPMPAMQPATTQPAGRR